MKKTEYKIEKCDDCFFYVIESETFLYCLYNEKTIGKDKSIKPDFCNVEKIIIEENE